MAKLSHKIQMALDENRMLMLGSQILIGLQFRKAFEKGFEQLSAHSRYLELLALALLMLALGLLLAPPAFHRIAERGEDTPRLHQLVTGFMCPALLPFIAGLAIELYVAAEKLFGVPAGLALGLGGGLFGLVLLYGLELVQRRRRAPQIREVWAMAQEKEEERGKTGLEEKIRQVLTEARVVLPGAQALMGFQFATLLMESFDKLPESSKVIHLISLTMIALSVVFLLAPASYHRIAERGEDTEHLHRFASAMVLLATVTLGLGVCGDFYVVVRKVTGSQKAGIWGAAAMLLFFYGLWFGLSLFFRWRKQGREPPRLGQGHPRAAGA